jgi:hypothetical protein
VIQFLIADFRLGAKRMNMRCWVRWWDSVSDNRKSKIQNRKLVELVAVVITFAMWGAVDTAQQPKKVHRIGYLSSFDPASESARAEAIRLALQELGHIEGQNIAIEYRYSHGKTIELLNLLPS